MFGGVSSCSETVNALVPMTRAGRRFLSSLVKVLIVDV